MLRHKISSDVEYLFKLALKFKKTAQDPFAAFVDQNSLNGEYKPNDSQKITDYEYELYLEWLKKHNKPSTKDNPELTQKFWNEFRYGANGEGGDPESLGKLEDFKENLLRESKQNNMEKEFSQQDKEIGEFLNKEQEDKIQQQKAIQGKTMFNQQDAGKIINPSLALIKASAAKIKASGQVNFIFYSNGSVGVSCANVALANLIRRKFVLEFQLELRQYVTNYKKYFATPSVVFIASI